MALKAADDRNLDVARVAAAPLGLHAVETVIMKSLATGEPQAPTDVIRVALDKGAHSEAIVKEALWSLIGSDVIRITDEYRLIRVK